MHFTLGVKTVPGVTSSAKPLKQIWVVRSPVSAKSDFLQWKADVCSHVTKESLFRGAWLVFLLGHRSQGVPDGGFRVVKSAEKTSALGVVSFLEIIG